MAELDGRGNDAAPFDLPDRIEAMASVTGGIAHDFNNLLTVIRGSAEMLKGDGAVTGPGSRHLDAIIAAADRAADLTGQLLAFARRQPLQPRAVDLLPVLAQLKDEFAAMSASDVSVRVLAPKSLRPAFVDPLQFAAALRAAAANAREAMPDGGVLSFVAANEGGGEAGDGPGRIQLRISDSGNGMAAAVLARAFEPFFTTKPIGEGPGLGLAHIHGFAAQSGGEVRLESAPGRGTTLILTLPAADPEAVAPDAPARPPAQGTHVLLVEDSDTVAAFAEHMLADMGLAVTRAANAEEALAILDKGDPVDILFSDIVMPGMSGLELAARVHADRPGLPILLATAHSEAAARGGSAFPILPKPYRRDALAAMMGSALAA